MSEPASEPQTDLQALRGMRPRALRTLLAQGHGIEPTAFFAVGHPVAVRNLKR